MWRRQSSPTPLYRLQPPTRCQNHNAVQNTNRKGGKAQLKHKKQEAEQIEKEIKRRSQSDSTCLIWLEKEKNSRTSRSVARSEMFRTRTVIPEEEIAIDIRIALLCHQSSWSRLLQKASISSLQNMVEATFRSKYVHFFVVLKEASRSALTWIWGWEIHRIHSEWPEEDRNDRWWHEAESLQTWQKNGASLFRNERIASQFFSGKN